MHFNVIILKTYENNRTQINSPIEQNTEVIKWYKSSEKFKKGQTIKGG